jgi:hypothetical protein
MVRLAPMLAVALALSHVARADAPAAGAPETPPAPVGGQRFVGIGAEVGFGIGIGAALHLGTRQLGVFVEAGALPIFVVGNQQTSRALTFDVYGAVELNANLYAMLFQPSPRTDLGLTAGYSGNTVLGNGLNLGVAARYDLAEKLALTIFGGVEIFPDAHDHLLAHGYSPTSDPSLPQLQGGANLGLVFYP